MRRLVGLGRQHVVVLALERGRPRLLEIVVDRGLVEAFPNGGRVAFTDLMFPPGDVDRVSVFAARSGQAASTLLLFRSSAAGRGCSKSSSISGRAKRSRTAVASRSPI
ncbi:hypothetical protein XM57_24915 [Burkholderia cepacia]|nr:hypothetical protein XM57_24915 [Burkholderia cepacia]ETP63718.1 hypothetical protein BDSB_18930 [Burkholderia dolosa PC543]